MLRSLAGAEFDVDRVDRAGAAPGRALEVPVEVRVRDHRLRRWRTVRGEVFGGVRIADERDVVAAGERSVDRGPHAGFGLRATDDHAPDATVGEHALEVGVLERVAVTLVHERF